MNVTISRVIAGWRHPTKGWKKGHVLACVDGHEVSLFEGNGWRCRCADDDCPHITAVEQLIDDTLLARIETGRPA